LVNITIPDTVEVLEDDAFNYCSSLEAVFYQGSRVFATDLFPNCDALKTVCVSPDYNSTQFGGKDVTSSTDLCLTFQGMFNQCFKGAYIDGQFVTEKRKNASQWEGRTSKCGDYICDNNNGPVAWSLCNRSDEMNHICVDEQCVEENTVVKGKDWSVVIELNEVKFDEMMESSQIKIIINELTGIKLEDYIFGVEAGENGYISHLLLYMDNGVTANKIASAIQGIEKGAGCTYGTLCETKSVRVVKLRNDDSSSSYGSQLTMSTMMSLFMMVSCIVVFF